MKNILNSKKVITILGFLGLYLLSTGLSWAMFSYLGEKASSPASPSLSELASARSKLTTDLPKTEECPINGGMFTKIEKDIWKDRRPITAVIENHLDARPLSGISKADVVYEAVAEGGITRFLAVFYCGVAADDVRVGPVRSARVYFINWATEYGTDPLFVHVGGANNICNQCPGGVKTRGTVAKEVDAFQLLNKLGWRYFAGNDLDGGTNVGYPVMWRDPERIAGAAYEHTFMGSTDKLFEEAAKRGFAAKDEDGVVWDEDFISWKFIDETKAFSPDVSKISFEFWSNKSEYDVEWKYDREKNEYLRSNGGKPFVDMDYDDEQISAKNVVAMFVKERGPVDKELHMFYQVVGDGEALIFQNGEVIEGTWEKEDLKERTIFYDEDGNEISFVRGPIWIETLPKGNDVIY